MQRWFFTDDNEVATEGSSKNFRPRKSEESSGEEREWTFKLLMNHDMQPNECMAISGSCASLGNWTVNNSVLLQKEEDSNNWFLNTNIPRDRQVYYRFFVCSIDPTTEQKHVRRWETHLHPRVIPEMADTTESNDIFGDINGKEKIDRGWLTTDSIVQLKFINSPFMLMQKHKSRLLYVKVTPMNLRIHLGDQNVTSLEDSLSNDTRENGADQQAPYGFSEVCCYKYDDCDIKVQPQFGVPCAANDVVVFHITVGDIDSLAYLIDLYTYSSKASTDEPPYHLGYHYILPNLLKRSEGKLEMPVTCATKHRPLGTMKLDYLLVKPFTAQVLDMRLSFARYWNNKWSGLDVGHRGSGTSFKTKDIVIRENTIASLKHAAAHGADMVEFDVQLSKDLVPVIYHDFHVYVSLKAKMIDSHDLLELPMRELTLEQLKNLKVYHVVEGRTREPRNFDNDNMEEHQPFPTLAEALDTIDSHVGFNIEIKWSQQLLDGTMEMEQQFDRNLYLDCILDVVFAKANTRRIVFSCFDPDICTMLRFKQNLYPVMFLTLGQTTRYPLYSDSRCNSIEKAGCHARAMELLGIVAHTEDILRDPTQVNFTRDLGLILFCWGDDNNSVETIQHLKKLGLHAIIYDKMDVLTTKEKKESVFLVSSKGSQSEFFKLHALEREKRTNDESINPKENSEKMLELSEDHRKIALSGATSFATLIDECME